MKNPLKKSGHFEIPHIATNDRGEPIIDERFCPKKDQVATILYVCGLYEGSKSANKIVRRVGELATAKGLGIRVVVPEVVRYDDGEFTLDAMAEQIGRAVEQYVDPGLPFELIGRSRGGLGIARAKYRDLIPEPDAFMGIGTPGLSAPRSNSVKKLIEDLGLPLLSELAHVLPRALADSEVREATGDIAHKTYESIRSGGLLAPAHIGLEIMSHLSVARMLGRYSQNHPELTALCFGEDDGVAPRPTEDELLSVGYVGTSETIPGANHGELLYLPHAVEAISQTLMSHVKLLAA